MRIVYYKKYCNPIIPGLISLIHNALSFCSNSFCFVFACVSEWQARPWARGVELPQREVEVPGLWEAGPGWWRTGEVAHHC